MTAQPPQPPPRDEFRHRLRKARGEEDLEELELETGPEVEPEDDAAPPPEFRFDPTTPAANERSTPPSAPMSPDGSAWPTWAVVDWDALEDATGPEADPRRHAGKVPPTPQQFDETRDRLLAAAAREAAQEHTAKEQKPPTVSRPEAVSDPELAPDAEAETELETPPAVQTGPARSKGLEDIEADPSATAADLDEELEPLPAEIVAREGPSSAMSLTNERMWELIKEAAYAAQEARERAARAEGESAVLRQELDRLREERRELTLQLAEGSSRRPWWRRRRSS